MRILVTGSSGHLGDALMRCLRAQGRDAVGLDLVASSGTDIIGSIADRAVVDRAMAGIDAVLHTATLHKPHIATHSREEFVDTNVTGTLHLLEAAVAAGVRAFVYTSTTSTFGDALTPTPGAAATWIDEGVMPLAKNIYGATKLAAEDLCRIVQRNQGLPTVVLRTSRFFPEPDDDPDKRGAYADANIKVNELLYRRADVQDLVDAHLLAIERAPAIGHGRFILSATTPFVHADLDLLQRDAPSVVARHAPGYVDEFARRGWRMFPAIERVYVNARARATGLAAGLRFRVRAGAAAGRRGSVQPAGAGDRDQGVSRQRLCRWPVSGRSAIAAVRAFIHDPCTCIHDGGRSKT